MESLSWHYWPKPPTYFWYKITENLTNVLLTKFICKIEPKDENFQIEAGEKNQNSPIPHWDTKKYKLQTCSQLSTKEAEASSFPSNHAGPSKPLQSQRCFRAMPPSSGNHSSLRQFSQCPLTQALSEWGKEIYPFWDAHQVDVSVGESWPHITSGRGT